MRLFNKISVLIICSVCLRSFAVNSLGGASDTLFTGVNLLTKFFWAACILIGIFLLVGSLVNYQSHKNNPKLVPMATVVTYFLLGVLTISIPFLNKLFGSDSYDTATQFSTKR